MNKLFLSLLLLGTMLSGFSCSKENSQAPGFDLEFQRDFSIPAGIGIFAEHHFQLKNIPSNWDQYLDIHGKTADEIKEVITAEASVGGIFGDVDLGVIERVSLRVYDEANPNDFVEIAYRDPAPFNSANNLPLIPSLANSKRFFTEPRFSLDLVVFLRETTIDQSDVRMSLKMRAVF